MTHYLRKKLPLILLLSTIFVLTFAGGGGSNKNGKGGNPPASNWIDETVVLDWGNAVLPGTGNGFCSTPPFSNQNGTNTYPDLPVQSVWNNPTDYFAKIIVRDATTNESRETKFIWPSTTVQIPQDDPYNITVEYVDLCTGCMRENVYFDSYFGPNGTLALGLRVLWKGSVGSNVASSSCSVPMFYNSIYVTCK